VRWTATPTLLSRLADVGKKHALGSGWRSPSRLTVLLGQPVLRGKQLTDPFSAGVESVPLGRRKEGFAGFQVEEAT
jgi:hypothetical protein